MIVVARKSLLMSPNSFIYTSIVHLSTSRLKRVAPSSAIYDLLAHKHEFSPKLASFASLHLNRVRNPKRADSVISFLKENSFTTAQMQKIILYKPGILVLDIEDISVKLKLFHDLGLSSEEVAKITSRNITILNSSTANQIVPALSVLQGLLGSNDDVARLLRRCDWFLHTNLEKLLIPNVEIFKSYGISMERIIQTIHNQPRWFLFKPDIMRKSVVKTVEIGISHSSKSFMNAAFAFAYMSEGMWEVRVQTLRDLGFSDEDVFTMFKKYPLVFTQSAKKIKNAIELLLATGKYNLSSIAKYPVVMAASIEKRLKPRLQILEALESRNLIKKWPGLSRLNSFTDDGFFDRFVRPYYDEIGEEFIAKIYGHSKAR